MNQSSRMGQLLGAMVPLSALDIEEILIEQRRTKRRFGQIALGWGLCEPQHVWHAWFSQLDGEPRMFNLSDIGIDTQAVASCPRDVALMYNVMPVRRMGLQLVVATTPAHLPAARRVLNDKLGMDVRFILCADEQVARALATYYPTLAQVG